MQVNEAAHLRDPPAGKNDHLVERAPSDAKGRRGGRDTEQLEAGAALQRLIHRQRLVPRHPESCGHERVGNGHAVATGPAHRGRVGPRVLHNHVLGRHQKHPSWITIERRAQRRPPDEGKVVAIDRATDRVVASAETPQEVMRLVADQGLRNTAIFRVLRIGEPLRVGLG